MAAAYLERLCPEWTVRSAGTVPAQRLPVYPGALGHGDYRLRRGPGDLPGVHRKRKEAASHRL